MSEQRITVAQLLKRLRVVNFDAAQDTRRKIESRVGPVTRKAECSYCCYAKILSPSYIGLFIYFYLKQEGAWTPELRARLVESDRAMTVRTHRGWLMARRPCPFLKVHSFGRGTCTVYPVRPEVCVVTHSVAGDGAKCAIVDETNLVSVLDNDNLLPYLPLVLAVQHLCKPIVTTLPASVLVAESVVEQLAMPDVASVPFPDEEPDRGWAEREFDAKFCTVPDGS